MAPASRAPPPVRPVSIHEAFTATSPRSTPGPSTTSRGRDGVGVRVGGVDVDELPEGVVVAVFDGSAVFDECWGRLDDPSGTAPVGEAGTGARSGRARPAEARVASWGAMSGGRLVVDGAGALAASVVGAVRRFG